MIQFQIGGNFTKNDAEKLVRELNGKTFMNFRVYCTNYACNYNIFVETDYKTTITKAKSMFYYNALTTLAKYL